MTQFDLDFYPKELHAEIDAVNALVYPNLNNGVLHDPHGHQSDGVCPPWVPS
jgi:glutathionyl-hydroquinone reductase